VKKIALLFAALAMLAGASVLSAQNPQSLTMTNAEVVSVDPSQRTMVIRNTAGKDQTVELDDQLAGMGGIRPGDKVVLSLRKGPGRDRVMSISKGGATAPPQETRVEPSTTGATVVHPPAGPGVAATVATVASLDAYSDRVAALAQQAGEVDRLWGELRSACNVIVDAHYDSREWVSLWDKQARVDLSSGSCRDLYNQVLTGGQTVSAGMAAAQESAKKAGIVAGDLRAVRQRYSMDWEGWGRTPPERLEQP
jgi:hypothetical protein